MIKIFSCKESSKKIKCSPNAKSFPIPTLEKFNIDLHSHWPRATVKSNTGGVGDSPREKSRGRT